MDRRNNNKTSYAYDDADRLISVSDAQTPSAGVSTYAYDTESNLTDIYDANQNHTQFAYINGHQLQKTTFPSGLYETYVFDGLDNLTSRTDRNGNRTAFYYDSLSRLYMRLYTADGSEVTYAYDAASRLTQANDANGVYTFGYDNMNRLTSTGTNYWFDNAGNYTVQYGYDAASNRTSMKDPQNLTTAYGYDTLNRLTSLAFNGQNPGFGFGYDNLSRRNSLTRPNGVSTSYSYDPVSRLLSVIHQLGSTTIDGASYTYDSAGNRNSKTDLRTNATSNYSYDTIYQLLQVTQGASTTETYTYDKVGNRLSSLGVSPYSYNSSNELTSTPTLTYTYDNNGNTKTKSDGTQYTWDYENRLTKVVLPGTGGTVNFKYDPFGRRVQKSFTQGSATTTTNYLYDGFNLLEEVDTSGNVLARYTQGPSLDEPLSMLRGGTTSYYQVDAVGTVSSLSNGAGGLADTYSYDSFGKPTASTGTITNPFRYTGREFDPETNLYFYRARYYDQNLGRFIGEDRLRFRAGNDFYVYVRNSPVDLRDPSGNDPALDGMVQGLMNIFPGSQLAGPPGAQYMVINKPCPEVARILEAQGYETGALPPFNNPFDHPGGFEFRTRGVGPGFHFRLPYPADPTDPMGMGSPLSPCPGSTCILDQFHIDPNNPLGGNAWDHFLDFIHSHGIDPEGFVDDLQQYF